MGGAKADQVKPFLSYKQQIELLARRGMSVKNFDQAAHQLELLNYYRLSGYWHSMRALDRETGRSLDVFRPGASFELVLDLYHFDEQLRDSVFTVLGRIELAMRALIGHQLGAINPLIHLDAARMGAPACQRYHNSSGNAHEVWLTKYDTALQASREEFVEHHRRQYAGKLPIWAAVEVMDWGMLSHLYRMAPNRARNEIAAKCRLRAPQLESWLKCLNIVRNYSAHHARMFNRVFDIKPKLPKDPRLTAVSRCSNRAFGQLTLAQYLLHELQLSGTETLPSVLKKFPHNNLVPFSRLGAPENWQENPLWATKTV
nr:Abi family protein [uncultured Mobiluncus sp.]